MVNVGALKTTISLDSAQFEQGMAGVNRQLKSLKQEQRAVTSSGTGFARGLTEMRSKADVLSRTFDVQQAKVQELRRRYEESRSATGEHSKATQEAGEAYQRAVAEMNKTENQLKNLTAEIRRQESPWTQLSESMNSAGQTLQDVGKKTTDFGKSWSMRVTAPIVGLGVAALTAGIEFEASMSKVQALTGATGDEMEAMTAQAKELGETTRFSASEAAEGMAFLGMAGWDTQAILDGMPGLLSLAASANMELGRAADITSNIMAAFNIEAAEASRVSDILAHAASNSNTNVEQLGEAMKYVAPTASTLGISIEDTAAAVMAVSDAGIQGSMAGRAFGTSLLRLSNPTKAMQKEMEKLNISFFDSEGVMKPLPTIIGELEKATADYTSEQTSASLSTLFGAEAQRHWAILLDKGSEALGENSKALEESEGAAQRMADTMMDNAKGGIVEFKSALEGAGIAISEHLLPTFTDLVDRGTELVRQFGQLDEGTQKTIITIAGLAAAIGPVAIVLGSMTTAIGGVLKVGGSLAGLLGKVGGSGLIARIGLLGLGGPVGWAITALTTLGGIIYAVTKDSEELNDVSFDTVLQMEEEVKATDQLINRYEELQEVNKLTTEEMLEYMDILALMSQTTAPDKLQELADRQNELLEKSGFTNEEMEEFLGLNDQVIEKAPHTAKAISSQGEAYAENTNALRELNAEKSKEMMMMARVELLGALENEKALYEEQKELISDIHLQYESFNDLHGKELKLREKHVEEQNKLNTLQDELKEMEQDSLVIGSDKWLQKKDEILQQQEIVDYAAAEHSEIKNQYDALEDKLKANKDNLDSVREQLAEIDTMKGEYERLILEEVGLNAERGKGITAINDQIDNLKKQKVELQLNTTENDKNTQEYRDQIGAIDDQIGKLEGARGKLHEVNRLASEDVYGNKNRGAQSFIGLLDRTREAGVSMNGVLGERIDKNLSVRQTPTTRKLDDDLGRPVSKRVNVTASVVGGVATSLIGYADGTPPGGHKGGNFLAGEEGWELGRMGNRWEMLNFGLYDRPRGYEVFTHDESKKIVRALNNIQIPGYATGARSPGEADRVINDLNQSPSSPVVIEVHVTSEMDSKAVGKGVARVVTDIQNRNTNRRRRRPS